jgi:hypothetical protein
MYVFVNMTERIVWTDSVHRSNRTTSEGAFIWVRSNSVVKGTEFLRFGLTIRRI